MHYTKHFIPTPLTLDPSTLDSSIYEVFGNNYVFDFHIHVDRPPDAGSKLQSEQAVEEAANEHDEVMDDDDDGTEPLEVEDPATAAKNDTGARPRIRKRRRKPNLRRGEFSLLTAYSKIMDGQELDWDFTSSEESYSATDSENGEGPVARAEGGSQLDKDKDPTSATASVQEEDHIDVDMVTDTDSAQTAQHFQDSKETDPVRSAATLPVGESEQPGDAAAAAKKQRNVVLIKRGGSTSKRRGA